PTRPRFPLSPYTTLFRSVGARPGAQHDMAVGPAEAERADPGGGRVRPVRPGFRPVLHLEAQRIECDVRAGGLEMQARREKAPVRSEEHTSELQSRENLVC